MITRLSCLPRLGQCTVIPAGIHTVDFTASIETGSASDQRDLEAHIWYTSGDSHDWEEYKLVERNNENGRPLTLRQGKDFDSTIRFFFGKLTWDAKPPNPIHFTVKFRFGRRGDWKWASDRSSVKNGIIIFGNSTDQSNDLDFYVGDTSDKLAINPEIAETASTALWSVTSLVNGATGATSGRASLTLGKPTSSARWFAIVQPWTPWIAPRHGSGLFAPDKNAILAAFLRNDGLHVVVLAVSGVKDLVSLLNHDEAGGIVIQSRNDSKEPEKATVLVAVSATFEAANSAVMVHARKLVSAYQITTSDQGMVELSPTAVASPQWVEAWYDGLTYCTWNGLGQNLTAEKIYHALDSLEEVGVNVTGLIIDDNWQTLDHEGEDQSRRGWMEFEANKKSFPDGLKRTVARIRDRHKSVKHVAVWHAMLGYWGGISPDGHIAKEYGRTCVPRINHEHVAIVPAINAKRLYDDFYRFLSSSGIDSVKTDAQFYLEELDDARDRREAINAYQDAWTINHLRYFAGKSISCMSQAPSILFHSQLPTDKSRLLVRNSDDYFPEIAASHPWHVFCNAHNSLFSQHLNVLPDWDMFQTSHDWAVYHAAARSVSGGPVYITDEPGKHDVELIKQLTAQTIKNETIVLRPSTVGKSVDVYVAYDDGAFLKVGAYHGRQDTGYSIVGVFNTNLAEAAELIHLREFPGTEHGDYLIRSHQSGSLSRPVSRSDCCASVHLGLPGGGCDILTASRLYHFGIVRENDGAQSTSVSVACLGLLWKMTGAAAIIKTFIHVEHNRRLRAHIILRALGTLGVYISRLRDLSLENDVFALLSGNPISLKYVRVDSFQDILEIDLLGAWNKLGGAPIDWSNEVDVEVFVR